MSYFLSEIIKAAKTTQNYKTFVFDDKNEALLCRRVLSELGFHAVLEFTHRIKVHVKL